MNKTKIIKLGLSHSQYASFQIPYKDRRINDYTNIKFLGIQTDKHMNWNTHMGQINPKSKQCMLCN